MTRPARTKEERDAEKRTIAAEMEVAVIAFEMTVGGFAR
jgi:hypothetical protein